MSERVAKAGKAAKAVGRNAPHGENKDERVRGNNGVVYFIQ